MYKVCYKKVKVLSSFCNKFSQLGTTSFAVRQVWTWAVKCATSLFNSFFNNAANCVACVQMITKLWLVRCFADGVNQSLISSARRLQIALHVFVVHFTLHLARVWIWECLKLRNGHTTCQPCGYSCTVKSLSDKLFRSSDGRERAKNWRARSTIPPSFSTRTI